MWLRAAARWSCASTRQSPLCRCVRASAPSALHAKVRGKILSRHSKNTGPRSLLRSSRFTTRGGFPRRSCCTVRGVQALFPSRRSSSNRAAVCLHMLELCAAQGKSNGALQRAAADALRRWQRVGGRSTGQVCLCGSETNERDARVKQGEITVESAAGGWWPVSFDWLDAWPAE